jgi:hypothetical protein
VSNDIVFSNFYFSNLFSQFTVDVAMFLFFYSKHKN